MSLSLEESSEGSGMQPVRRPVRPWVDKRSRGKVAFEAAIDSNIGQQAHPNPDRSARAPQRARIAPAAAPAEPLPFKQPMTTRQHNFLLALARELGMTESDLLEAARERFGTNAVSDLDRRQASELIGWLQVELSVPVAS